MATFKLDLPRLRHVITILRDHGDNKGANEVKRLIYYYLYTANLAPPSEEAFEHWIKTGEGNVNNSNNTRIPRTTKAILY